MKQYMVVYDSICVHVTLYIYMYIIIIYIYIRGSMRMWETHTKVGRTSIILLSQLLQRWEGHSQYLSHDIMF